jgi:hypothetical protein
MASIEITRDELIVRIHGWNKVLAMRGTLRIPMSHVRAVRVRPKEAHFDEVIVESWRGVGTYVPHKVAAGFLYLADGTSFYDVRDPERAIAVDVAHESMRHVVVQIDNEAPEDAVRRIEQAMGVRSRSAASDAESAA